MNTEFNQGLKFCQKFAKMTGNNPKLDLVNVDVHTKFWSDSVNLFSRYGAETKL